MKDKKKVIEQLRLTSIVTLACQNARVPRATFYRWLKSDKKFKEMVDEAKKEGSDVLNDLAESKLMVAIKNGDLKAIIYRLNHCHPSYSDKRLNLSENEQKQFIKDIDSKRIEEALKTLLDKLIKGEISKSAASQTILMINKIYPHEVESLRQQKIGKTINDMANLIDEFSPKNRNITT